MTGIAEAIAALAGIKTIADGLVATRDEAKSMEIKLALMGQIYEVRQALDALQEQIATVKAEKAQLQQENLELQKRLDAVDDYDLIQLIGGVHVLASKPVSGESHKPPYFCQTCHGEGKKAPLSFEESTFGDSHFPAHLHCQRNKSHTLNLPGGTKAKQIGYAS